MQVQTEPGSSAPVPLLPDGRQVSHAEAELPRSSLQGRPVETLLRLAFDVAASVVFWYLVFFFVWPWWLVTAFLVGLLATAVAWRFYRAQGEDPSLPYTCGYVRVGDRELFLVATIHISPRSPTDVEQVVGTKQPDLVMIELDQERLDSLRGTGQAGPSDLQPVTVAEPGEGPVTVHAQRAVWNAEFAGQTFKGDLVFDEGNPCGVEPLAPVPHGSILLVHRGGPTPIAAAFAMKAFAAARSGAAAVLVIDREGELTRSRIGVTTLMGELLIAFRVQHFGYPPVPVLLLPHTDGRRLAALLSPEGGGRAGAEFQVLPDDYPRRTTRFRLCQAVALVVTGIGVLYEIIACFAVEVGKEFLAADAAAAARGVACACIDVDEDHFWRRLGWALVPSPRNVAGSLLSWLALPRILARVFFPWRGDVDVLGSTLLHCLSFRARTWVAFAVAACVACAIASLLLQAFSMGVTESAAATGVVKEKDKTSLQLWLVLSIEFYALPCLYSAVVASRDEAMYSGIVGKGQEHSASRMVVVCGAGHANGILTHARRRGL